MLTGVTRIPSTSIFSDLNHLRNISLNDEYSGVCGISQKELTSCFEPELRKLAENNQLTYEETLAKMKKHYNGYHFSESPEGVYNPDSVFNAFMSLKFRNYWPRTSTIAFLVALLKENQSDVRKFFDNDVRINMDSIDNFYRESGNPVPLLYQSGYLTIKKYHREYNEFTLGLPNEEIRRGFLNELLLAYIPQIRTTFFVNEFIEDLKHGNVESFMTRLQSFFACVPYDLNNKTEKDFQTIFYLIFKLMGQFITAEEKSAAGRSDAVVETPDVVYVFEFKLDTTATAEDALKQINDKGYAVPYVAGNRKVVKVGAEFSAQTRTIARWVVG
jgi:hypothetical protein